jgi:hypothetical protein
MGKNFKKASHESFLELHSQFLSKKSFPETQKTIIIAAMEFLICETTRQKQDCTRCLLMEIHKVRYGLLVGSVLENQIHVGGR